MFKNSPMKNLTSHVRETKQLTRNANRFIESPPERIIEQPRIQESNSLQTNKYHLRVNIICKLDYYLGKMYKSVQK